MARKTNAQLGHEKRLKTLMANAGIYEERYDLQMEILAEHMCERDDIVAEVKREGRTLIEDKTGGVGVKRIPHPSLMRLGQLEQLIIRELAALGLNKLQEKKSEAKEAKRQEVDGVMSFMNGRNKR